MDFLTQAQVLAAYSIGLRRKFHQQPELAFEEFRSSDLIFSTLVDLGYEVEQGVGKTGVVAYLRGRKENPVVMLRFDMDALPIVEQNQFEHRSRVVGKMHACGHDAHMAIGLTAARIISANIGRLNGSVKLIFQPAEEIGLGAKAMIEAGVMENPKVDIVLGIHVWNEKPIGWFGIPAGPMMAGSDMFEIKVVGKGGHGAIPQSAVDPIIAGAGIISAINSIVSRNISPLDAAVISVTSVHGGTTSNVIPSEIEMKGTLRSFNTEVRKIILDRLDTLVHSMAEAMGCRAELKITPSTGPVLNDGDIALAAQTAVNKLFRNAIIDKTYQTMGSEDFSFFLKSIPGAFMFVGSADKSNAKDQPHHHPLFDIDEESITIGTAVIVQTCFDICGFES